MVGLRTFAKNNPNKARFILTLVHITLPFVAIYFGGLLYDIGWVLPTILIPILTVIFFFAFYFYPNKKRQNRFFKYSYRRKKTLDFTFVMVSFFLIATSVNDLLISPPESHSKTAKSEFIVLKRSEPPQEKTSTKPFKKIKEIRKNIRKEIRAWKKTEQQPKRKGLVAEKVLLILLTLGVAIVLGYLVFALGCNLACSGHEALAVVVYVVGFTGILVGAFFAIRAIVRMGNKTESR